MALKSSLSTNGWRERQGRRERGGGGAERGEKGGRYLSLTVTTAVPRPAPAPPALFQTISSRIWPPSLEQGLWPPDYNISDHGSLTASFRIAPAAVVVPPSSSEGDSIGAGSPGGRADGKAAASAAAPFSATGAAGAAAAASLSAAADEDDDGHYGLR